jgi:ribosomal protein S18 acetylase RimI-like enzyme
MTDIRPLDHLNLADLRRVASGYVSECRYRVLHEDAGESMSFRLVVEPLPSPYVKKYSFDEEILAAYRSLLPAGFSFGVYDNGRLIGLAISELHLWNNTLQVHDFHIAEPYRGQGLGRLLMDRVEEAARAASVRVILCETQNKNVPAILFYQRMGFVLEGLDLSHYRNTDYPDGEVAVFMKRRLT